MSADRKGKVCPVVEERCHYLVCQESSRCARLEPTEAPPFVRTSTREPSPLRSKANG